jgi:hypothetical protein
MVSRKKARSNIDRESVSKILRPVSYPEAFLFFTDVGQYIGELASSLNDFCEKLKKIPLKSVEFHFERGDFEKWIRETLRDENLANMLSKIGKSIRGEELRTTIQRMVERRLSQLEKIAETKS